MKFVFLLLVGLAGLWFAYRAVIEGEINVILVRFGPWFTLDTDVRRGERPIAYWVATVCTGGAGLFLTGFALVGWLLKK